MCYHHPWGRLMVLKALLLASVWVTENLPQSLNGYDWQIRGIPSGCITGFRNPDKWLIEA